MVGKSRWFRRRKQFPVLELPAQKPPALRLRVQLLPSTILPATLLPSLKLAGLGLLVLPILLLILALAMGCSRPSELPADERVKQADQRKLPFEDNAAKGNSGSNAGNGDSGEANSDPASNSDPRAAGGPPFQSPSAGPDLPPGTLITVRVESQIFIDRTGADRTGADRTGADRTGQEGTFAGVVDEPVVVDGRVAVPRGATVTGRIEAAPASGGGRGRGYIRLTLDTITIAGKTMPLRTSDLFVRGSAGEVLSAGQNYEEPAHPTVTRLQKGRRLTFRLAATVPQDRQETVSNSQNYPTSTE
jgi:hypothetical protein